MDKNGIWDRTPPHLHINCTLHVWGRAQGSQIFKRNSIISIRSKVMAFLVILLSPCGPRHPHVIPTSFPSSPCRPRHPHIVPIAHRRSPCGLHGLWSLWSPHVVPIIPPSSPRHLRCPHVIPTSSLSSSHHPRSPQKVLMWSPWSVVSVVSSCCPRHPRVIPIIPTWSPHHLEGLHIIPNPPDTHPKHPPTSWGMGAPNQ